MDDEHEKLRVQIVPDNNSKIKKIHQSNSMKTIIAGIKLSQDNSSSQYHAKQAANVIVPPKVSNAATIFKTDKKVN